MRLDDLPVTDVRRPIAAQRGRLLDLLDSLSDAQWAARTGASGWSVKDIALHLLDVDLSWLSRERDRDGSGRVAVSSDPREFAG